MTPKLAMAAAPHPLRKLNAGKEDRKAARALERATAWANAPAGTPYSACQAQAKGVADAK